MMLTFEMQGGAASVSHVNMNSPSHSKAREDTCQSHLLVQCIDSYAVHAIILARMAQPFFDH
jgi:hypothetical protein